jgi:hypothetical protein
MLANVRNSTEADAIEAAYVEQVRILFRLLITNLGDEPVTHKTDQQCLDMFAVGLNTAKRAKQLALTVAPPVSPARLAAVEGADSRSTAK